MEMPRILPFDRPWVAWDTFCFGVNMNFLRLAAAAALFTSLGAFHVQAQQPAAQSPQGTDPGLRRGATAVGAKPRPGTARPRPALRWRRAVPRPSLRIAPMPTTTSRWATSTSSSTKTPAKPNTQRKPSTFTKRLTRWTQVSGDRRAPGGDVLEGAARRMMRSPKLRKFSSAIPTTCPPAACWRAFISAASAI